jgi:hypothetical protein
MLGASPGLAQPVATPAWSSGFENGFPGEFLDYNNGSWSETGDELGGRSDTWTIMGDDGAVPVYRGEHMYKGWAHGASDELHRPYPVLHTDIPSPLVNRFMVYIDADYDQVGEDWIHLATWGNNEDWIVHTMSVRFRKVEMAHLDWEWIGPDPAPDFPLHQWVRFTVYIDYEAEEGGLVHVWQDGMHIMRGVFTQASGNHLLRAHWGLYAPGTLTQGAEYNDEIQIWTLSEPLTDFEKEPSSPYDGGDDASGEENEDGGANETDAGGDGGVGNTDLQDSVEAPGASDVASSPPPASTTGSSTADDAGSGVAASPGGMAGGGEADETGRVASEVASEDGASMDGDDGKKTSGGCTVVGSRSEMPMGLGVALLAFPALALLRKKQGRVQSS